MEQRQYGQWPARAELIERTNELITAVALGNVDHVRHVGAQVLELAELGARFVCGEDHPAVPEPSSEAGAPDGGAELPAVAQANGDDDDEEEDEDDEALLKELAELREIGIYPPIDSPFYTERRDA